MSGRRDPVRILVVEDNQGDVYLLEKALQQLRMQYQLTHYADGDEALAAMARENSPLPDLILLDLNLPRREGFDVLRFVRNSPRWSDVPIGVLTSSDAAKDRHRVTLIGAERYIHKPPTLEEFIERVGRAVDELLNPSEAHPRA